MARKAVWIPITCLQKHIVETDSPDDDVAKEIVAQGEATCPGDLDEVEWNGDRSTWIVEDEDE